MLPCAEFPARTPTMTCDGDPPMPMAAAAVLQGLAGNAHIGAVRAELAAVFDECEIAQWFVTPNGWLGQRTPLAMLADAPREVHAAARADRFVVCG